MNAKIWINIRIRVFTLHMLHGSVVSPNRYCGHHRHDLTLPAGRLRKLEPELTLESKRGNFLFAETSDCQE